MASVLGELLADTWGRRVGGRPESRPPSPPDVPPGAVVIAGLEHDEHLDALERGLVAAGREVGRVAVDRPRSWQIRAEPPAPGVAAAYCRTVAASTPLAHHNEHVVVDTLGGDTTARVRGFADRERDAAALAMLAAIVPRRWVNSPDAHLSARIRTRQLTAAHREGLRIPRTLISDDPAAIREFTESCGTIVHKCLSDPVVWMDGTTAGFLYTTPLPPTMLDGLEDMLPVPGLFQERLTPRAEHRVTVVGTQVFTATTTALGETVDWRRRLPEGVPFRPGSLSPEIEAAAQRTVRRLGLEFAAVDLLETDTGIWFLEANPDGAYLWLEHSLDLPITAALCELLTDRA